LEKKEAFREVDSLGHSYFYDFLDETTHEEILSQIQRNVRNTHLSGLLYWEKWRDALQVVLDECGDAELDNILSQSYALFPKEVGGSRQFLSHLYEVIAGAIEKQRQQ
jgi:hypothetical protein